MSTSEIFSALAQLEQSGGAAALCTVVRTRGSVPRHAGAKLLVYPDGRLQGTIGGGETEQRVLTEARAVLETNQPRLASYTLADPQAGDPGVCGGEMDIFIEPIRPRPVLLIIGGGHVGQAVAQLANWLGFSVAVSDDRPEFCTPAAVPGAHAFYPGPAEQALQTFAFNSQTCIVVLTRSSALDVELLPLLLAQPHAYLGVIGSRRRWAVTSQALLARGLAPEKLAAIHAPLGLAINAETPAEIAVSILAEIIAQQRSAASTRGAAAYEPSSYELVRQNHAHQKEP
jgi:xanthine dehydrogenase accessory factor